LLAEFNKHINLHELKFASKEEFEYRFQVF